MPASRYPVLALLVLQPLAGCAHAVTNYADTPGPRYAGSPLVPPDSSRDSLLRVVTWNVKWGKQPEATAEILATHERLKSADLVLLQEMNENAVAVIAGRLGLGYVYYPATLHPRLGHNVGNAILSRWPLIEDRKLILPHLDPAHRTGRAAVVATVLAGDLRLRVYSLHLSTPFAIGQSGIEDQLRAVVRDAAASPDPVLIAGDFNSSLVGGLMVAAGYQWVTRRIGRTAWILPIDHVFVRGFEAGSTAGTVALNPLPSDHRPVWTEMRR